MIFNSLRDLRDAPSKDISDFFGNATFTGYFSLDVKSKHLEEYCGSIINIKYQDKSASFIPYYINVRKECHITAPGYYRIRFYIDIDKLKAESMNFLTIKSMTKLYSIHDDHENKDVLSSDDKRKSYNRKTIALGKFPNFEQVVFSTDDTRNNSNISTGITKIDVDVKNIVVKDSIYYYEVLYLGDKYYVRLLPFEINMLDRVKSKSRLSCVILGLDNEGKPRLVQDKNSLVEDLYEADTIGSFMVIDIRYDYNDNNTSKYYMVKDNFGLKHRYYAGEDDKQYQKGDILDLYIKGINKKNKTLLLSLYNPNLERLSRVFFDADKVFTEINELDNKEQYFDCYFAHDRKFRHKLEKDLVGQYNGESNLWLFTFMNVLDNLVVNNLIDEHKMEELAIVCHIMIKIQKWMIEESDYLDLFSEDTKNDTIQKSAYQIEKFEGILKAIEIVKCHKQDEYIKDIISAIKKSGRIAINKKERLSILNNILRITPEYISQDLSVTCELVKELLALGDEIDTFYLMSLVTKLDYYVEFDARKIRTTTFRTNDIDTTQTIIINEILSLLCIETILLCSEKCRDELRARSVKARFFRILSLVCNKEHQPSILEAGINAVVGVLDDDGIFIWENAKHINPIQLCNLTLQATVVDSNVDNDYYFVKPNGKTGLVLLDATGFTLIPHKQCIQNLRRNLYLEKRINVIHSLENMPLKLGTMLNFRALDMPIDAIGLFVTWNNVAHSPNNLELSKALPIPQEGDKLLVMVKEQHQTERLKNLLFVSVIDQNYDNVDGVINIKDISSRKIEDARNLFEPGDIFYAKTCKTHAGKFAFSIKEFVDQDSTNLLNNDLHNIVLNKEKANDPCSLHKELLQEMLLLMDLRIKSEKDYTQCLALIGYAYCLSAIISDPKSYYYDFMLRYYATIEKFVNDDSRDVKINFHNTKLDQIFKGLKNKRYLVEMLSLANSRSQEDINSLRKLVDNESHNDVGKLAAMLLAYIYVQRVGLSSSTLQDIRGDIKDFINNTNDIDLSALETVEELESVEDVESEENTDSAEFLDSTDEVKEDSISEDTNINIVDNNSTHVSVVDDVQKLAEPFVVGATNSTEEIKTIEPLEISIYDDGSYTVTGEKVATTIAKGISNIKIPIYALNGILLIFNNDSSYAKMQLSSISAVKKNEKNKSEINPYKLSNYFVVPTDCIVGMLITAVEGKYIEMFRSLDIPCSNFVNIVFTKNENLEVLRFQPFILPKSFISKDDGNLIGQCVKQEDLSSSIVSKMNSLGVFI